MKAVAFSLVSGVILMSAVLDSGAAEDESRKPFLVPKILSIDIALEKRLPPNLVVTATGEVPTPNHLATLTRVVYAMPPADGIQDYHLKATPPSGVVPQVISTVTASDRWVDYQGQAPWLTGVRIHGIDKGVRVKMLDE